MSLKTSIHGSKVNTSHPIPNCLLTNQKGHPSCVHKPQQQNTIIWSAHINSTKSKMGIKVRITITPQTGGKISTPLNLDLFHSLPMTIKTPSHLTNQLDTIHASFILSSWYNTQASSTCHTYFSL